MKVIVGLWILIAVLVVGLFLSGCDRVDSEGPTGAADSKAPLSTQFNFKVVMWDSMEYVFPADSVKYGGIREILVYNNGDFQRFPTPWKTILNWKCSNPINAKFFYCEGGINYLCDSVICPNIIMGYWFNNGTMHGIDWIYERVWVIKKEL